MVCVTKLFVKDGVCVCKLWVRERERKRVTKWCEKDGVAKDGA